MTSPIHCRPSRILTGLLLPALMLLTVSCTRSGSPPGESTLDQLRGFVAAVVERLRDRDVEGALAMVRRYAEHQELRAISAAYYRGDHEAVTRLSDEFLRRHALTDDNFGVLLYKAESHYQRGELDPAMAAYRRSLPFVERLHNVQQRRYAYVFFRLGSLYARKAEYGVARDFVEAGLRREPQNGYYQFLLAELLHQSGRTDRAVAYLRDLMGSPSLTNEEKVVLGLKIDRFDARPDRLGRPTPPDLSDAPFYPGIGFQLVPINHADPRVSLGDICVLLESKWLVGCEVLAPVELDEARIRDPQRRQYDGDRVLDELTRLSPPANRPGRFLVAITGRDIFGPNTSYVFSWQSPRDRVGVVSSYRFAEGWEDFYELDVMITRRLGIQFISTTGSLLGFARPTRPDCPMAYPHDFREFMQKGPRLCDSTIAQRDQLLRRAGGVPGRFGRERADAVARIYQAYRFE